MPRGGEEDDRISDWNLMDSIGNTRRRSSKAWLSPGSTFDRIYALNMLKLDYNGRYR